MQGTEGKSVSMVGSAGFSGKKKVNLKVSWKGRQRPGDEGPCKQY